MKLSNSAKILILLVGDIVALYAALLLTLFLRYGDRFEEFFFTHHFLPFTFIFPVWILIFYIAGLYDLPRLRNNLEFLQTLTLTLGINALTTIALFYLIPAFGITPKTNLFIFMVVFAAIEAVWRRTFNIRASFREGLNKVLLLDSSSKAAEIVEVLKGNPQVGYEVRVWLKGGLADSEIKSVRKIVRQHGITLIVVPRGVQNHKLAKEFYDLFTSGVQIFDVPSFYEVIFRKVPLRELDESWFLEHHIGQKKFYDDLKRGLEFIFALLLVILLLPLELLLAFFIKITSRGPVLIRQKRVGQFGEPFTLYKFRSMIALSPDGQAETEGPVISPWKAKGERDPRLTPVGRIIASTHLDELPQLINILLGEMSFVGPRPERPEFVTTLEEQIPYYEIRHLVKPGVTGWAQINHGYATVEDTQEKLEYDIYYLKNRSVILDIAIVLKTLKSFFVNQT